MALPKLLPAGETGTSSRQKINNSFTQVDTNETNITNNTTEISTNAASITTNATNIADKQDPIGTGNPGQVLATDAAGTNTEWVDQSGGGGSGDVVGPNVSMDGTIAMFDGLSGKLIKDSHITPGTIAWNANKLQGRDISNAVPTDGQALIYDASIPAWKPATSSGGVTVVDNLTSTSSTDALSANMGTNLLDLLELHENNETRHLSANQNDALDGANAPDAANVLATMADITAGGGVIVEDNLTSTSAVNALSANQGKVLMDEVSAHELNAHMHISVDQSDALDAANSPDSGNPIATMADIGSSTTPDLQAVTDQGEFTTNDLVAGTLVKNTTLTSAPGAGATGVIMNEDGESATMLFDKANNVIEFNHKIVGAVVHPLVGIADYVQKSQLDDISIPTLSHISDTDLHISADQNAALDGANNPGTNNVFATMDDVSTGGGDVSSSTTSADGNIAVFDGATGKLIKDAGYIQDTDVWNAGKIRGKAVHPGFIPNDKDILVYDENIGAGQWMFKSQTIYDETALAARVTQNETDIAAPDITKDNISINNSLVFPLAADPIAKGKVLRIGDGGLVELYQLPILDSVQTDTMANSMTLDNNFQEIYSIDTAEALLTTDTTLSISGDYGNYSGNDQPLTIQIKLNGTIIVGPITYTLWQGQPESETQVILTSTGIPADIPTGVLTVEMKSDNSAAVKINGDTYIGTFKITKAAVNAPVTTFENLIDVSHNYAGKAGQALVVNTAEDGVEFVPAPVNDEPLPTTGMLARYAASTMTPIEINHAYRNFVFTDTTTVDRGNGFFEFVTVGGRPTLKVTEDGIYKIHLELNITAVLSTTLSFKLFINGAEASMQESARETIGGGNAVNIALSGVLEIGANESIELQVKGNVDTEIQVVAANWYIEKTNY